MPVTEPRLIADLVRETGQRLGLTQEQFAVKLGVSYQSVNQWENDGLSLYRLRSRRRARWP